VSPILLIAGKETGELLLDLRGLAWLLAMTVVLSASPSYSSATPNSACSTTLK